MLFNTKILNTQANLMIFFLTLIENRNIEQVILQVEVKIKKYNQSFFFFYLKNKVASKYYAKFSGRFL